MVSQEKFSKRLRSLTDGDIKERREAARKLGKAGNREAVAPLCQALEDPSWFVRRNAARALGRLRDASAVEPLMGVLNDRTANVRREAVWALGQIGDARAVEALCERIQDSKPSVRESVFTALVEIGTPAVGALCRMLSTKNTPHRATAATALVRMLPRNGITLIYSILAAGALTGPQRWSGLELLRGHRPGLFRAPYLTDIRRFCEQARQHEDSAIRSGAQSVLDYMTLARPSQRDFAAEKGSLLRAARGAPPQDGAEFLLRASDAEGRTPVSPRPTGRIAILLLWWKRWFRRG